MREAGGGRGHRRRVVQYASHVKRLAKLQNPNADPRCLVLSVPPVLVLIPPISGPIPVQKGTGLMCGELGGGVRQRDIAQDPAETEIETLSPAGFVGVAAALVGDPGDCDWTHNAAQVNARGALRSAHTTTHI